MRFFDIFILALFALPSVCHLVVYRRKSEEQLTRSALWGILALCGISIAYAAVLIALTRFY